MYKICPKCHYEKQAGDPEIMESCPACGVIYKKWLKQQFKSSTVVVDENTTGIDSNLFQQVFNQLLYVVPKTEPFYFYPRAILFVLLLIWGWQFIVMDFVMNPYEIGSSFMHNINLVFHEAGHVIFRPFGWFMTILGGTLFQLIMPLIVMLAFIIKNHDNFAASIGLWWLGQSFMDSAPYIDDALDQKLVLLGGRTGADAPGNHDWNNILGELNMLERHREFATVADSMGTVLMVLAFAWGGYILYQQYKNLN